MQQRLFTIDEANTLIPKLEMIMLRLQRQASTLREAVQELVGQADGAAQDLSIAQILERRPELRAVVEDIEALLGEIEAVGGHMKGFDLGLVDFPAEVDGEVVLLCWQYGEKEVGYYHTMEAGFSGRKPLHPHAEHLRVLQ